MSVDMKMLAKSLNLSISTVSRALKDSHEISDGTKKRVREMAEKLNYHPNPYASSLRKHKSKTIAVVIPEITNNFFALAINGIEYVAQEKDYHVLIYLTHEKIEREVGFAAHFKNGRIDGMLISLSAETNNYDHLIDLKNNNLPIVFFDRICESIESSYITTDDFESGFAATEHLISRGCRRIAYFDLSNHLSVFNNRMQGYLSALVKNNINIDERLILHFGNNIAENEESIAKVLSDSERPDGIFSSVEKLAISTYRVCERLSLNIPHQIKIISFSNMEISSLLNPSLSTINQPAFEIGKNAAIQLFRYLESKNSINDHKKIVLKSTLIPGRSTGL